MKFFKKSILAFCLCTVSINPLKADDSFFDKYFRPYIASFSSSISPNTYLYSFVALCIGIPLWSRFSQSLKKPNPESNNQNEKHPTLSEWHTACMNLPQQSFNLSNMPQEKPVMLTAGLLEKTVQEFLETMKKSLTHETTEWVDGKCPIENFDEPEFVPYVQKLELPEGTQVIFNGDLHGDIRSPVTLLNDLKKENIIDDTFKIIKDNVHITFLGDYTDKGNYGIECIYTVLRLKNQNPEKVTLIRGNHEDEDITYGLGFQAEVKRKFENGENLLKKLKKIYELMPICVYIGSHSEFFQCNHGGMEFGYLPEKLLRHKANRAYQQLGALVRNTNFQSIEKTTKVPHELKDFTPDIPSDLSHLWGDFEPNSKSNLIFDTTRNHFRFNKDTTEKVLRAHSTEQKSIVGVLRAHQHTDETMPLILKKEVDKERGVAFFWKKDKQEGQPYKNMVATFCVAPHNYYGSVFDYDFATYGKLTIGTNLEKDWRLEIKNYKALKQN